MSEEKRSWTPIRSVPYLRMKIYSRDHETSFYFAKEDAEKALRYGYDLFVEEMLSSFDTTGCRYCCYGTRPCWENCMRKYEDESELDDYFRLHDPNPNEDGGFNLKLYTIGFREQEDGGFRLEEKRIWCLKKGRTEAFFEGRITLPTGFTLDDDEE